MIGALLILGCTGAPSEPWLLRSQGADAPVAVLPIRSDALEASLRMLVAIDLSPHQSFRSVRPLADCLEKATAQRVELVLRRTLAEARRAVHAADPDLVLARPVLSEDLADWVPLADWRRAGLEANPLVVAVRKDDPAAFFEDLLGASFAFSDPAGAGFRGILELLAERGLEPSGFLGPSSFTGGEDRAVASVVEGVTRATAVSAERLVPDRAALRVVWRDDQELPPFQLLAASPEALPAEAVRTCRNAAPPHLLVPAGGRR